MKIFELYKKHINIRITVIAVITYIIITTIIGVYAGRNSRVAVRQEVSNNLSNQAEVFAKNLEDMIQMRQMQISQIVAEGVFEKYQRVNQPLPVYDEDFQELVLSFKKYINNDETIDRFVFINPSGDGITTELNKVDLRERVYYKECAAKLKNPEPDVIISKTSKLQTLMYSTPIFGQNGSLIGILSVGIGGKHLSRTINRIHNGDLCPYIIRRSGQIIAHSNTGLVMQGENFLKDSEHSVLISQMLKENNKGFQQYYKNKELVYAGYCPVEGCDWYVVCPLKEIEVNSLKNNGLKIFLTAVILELIASIFMYFLGLKLTNPIKKVLRGLNDITAGELNLPNLDKKELNEILSMQDEIGELANGLNDLRQKMIEVTQNIQEVSKMVNDSSQVLKASVEEMSNGVNDQASSTEEFSATMDRISDNINQSTTNAKETAIIAKQTSNNSIEASNKVLQTVEMMKQIEQKINIVDNIAQKTNVLALNATVEAARAGNAGKGFAVVAAEVRKLAELSQNAASEIIKLVKQSYKISQESGQGIKNVLPEIQKTGELVDQISELCQEQSNSISQMKIGIEQINNITQNNSSSAEELSAMASQLYELSTKLEESVKFFKL